MRGDKWIELGSAYGMPGGRGTQHHTFKDSKQPIGRLEITLIAGGVERNQDVVGESAPSFRGAWRWSVAGGAGIVHWAAEPFVLAAALARLLGRFGSGG